MGEWYNAAQTQVVLAKYPQETAKIYRDIFWFFLRDEELHQKPSMTVTLISINSLQARPDNWQRKWKAPSYSQAHQASGK